MELALSYIKAARLWKTINFSWIIVGVYFATQDIHRILSLQTLFLYFCFTILCYVPLYVINDVVDNESLYKKHRKSLFTLSFLSILVGLVLLLRYFPVLLVPTVWLIIINLFYTFFLRGFNIYLACAVVALTGPTRVFMGYLLAASIPGYYFSLFLLHYLCSVLFHVYRNMRKRRR